MPTDPEIWFTADGRELRIADMVTSHIRNAKAYLERGDEMRFEDNYKRSDYIRAFKRELNKRQEKQMSTMTVAEAREFFKLWPTWRYSRPGSLNTIYTIMRVEDNGVVDIGEFGTWNSVDEFLTAHELCVGPSHVPVGSWWLIDGSDPVRVDSTVRGEVLVTSLGGRFSRYYCTATEFAQGRRRITPENFPWAYAGHVMLCVVCGKGDSIDRHAQCVRALVAVFGSTSRWESTYAEWKKNKSKLDHIAGKAVPADPPKVPVTTDRVVRGTSVLIITQAADRALRFLAGLNLQDHSVKEQRESVDVVRELIAALRPGAR